MTQVYCAASTLPQRARLAVAIKDAALACLDDVAHVPSPWNTRLSTNLPPTEQDDRVEIAVQFALGGLDQIMHMDEGGLFSRVKRYCVDAHGHHICRTASKLSGLSHIAAVSLLLHHGPKRLFDPSACVESLFFNERWVEDAALASQVLEFVADHVLQTPVRRLLETKHNRVTVLSAACAYSSNSAIQSSVHRIAAAQQAKLEWLDEAIECGAHGVALFIVGLTRQADDNVQVYRRAFGRYASVVDDDVLDFLVAHATQALVEACEQDLCNVCRDAGLSRKFVMVASVFLLGQFGSVHAAATLKRVFAEAQDDSKLRRTAAQALMLFAMRWRQERAQIEVELEKAAALEQVRWLQMGCFGLAEQVWLGADDDDQCAAN